MGRPTQAVDEDMTAGRTVVSAVWDLLLALVVGIPLVLPPVAVGLVYWFLVRNDGEGSRQGAR